MTKIFKILFLAVIALSWSCNRLSPFTERDVVARVGETTLYLSDVASIFTPDLTPQDSVKLLESYVDMWVKQQLKIQEAEKMFGQSGSDIDRMVEEYRNQLLSHKLEQYFVEKYVDTLIDKEEVAKYYDDHRAEFVLDRSIVKGRIVRLPENHRQKPQLRQLISSTGESFQDFLDISQKNGFDVYEYGSWTELSDFFAIVPGVSATDYEELAGKVGVQEYKDGADSWLILVTATRSAGDYNPLERISDVIERILYTQRKQEIIRSFEDSLYNSAFNRGRRVEIKLNQ